MKKEFQTIIIPIIKGIPILLVLLVLAISFAAKLVSYTTPLYQSNGSIKIDNRTINLGELALFEEEGRTKGVSSVDFLTEVEMFKSKRLKELTFEKLNFELDYFRVGEVKTTELYQNNPIVITYETLSQTAYDKLYYLKYVDSGRFVWSRTKDVFPTENMISIEDTIRLPELSFSISENEEDVLGKRKTLELGQVLAFRINSKRELVASVNESNYFVRSIDEKIQLVKLYYQHEVPEKAALFVNALLETYIEFCKEKHQKEADKTLQFIDEQLELVQEKLKKSEGQLVRFKTEKNIMNLKQQTDATLKELLQLEFQKVNYDLQEKELRRTFDYLLAGNDLKDFSPNFEALNNPIFRDAFLKIKSYEFTKQDLLLKYTDKSEEVQNISFKIKSMRRFIHESLKNALENIAARRGEVEEVIANVSSNIQDFPNKEQQMAILQRVLSSNENIYNALMEKRMEIAVAKSATTVFHQIVDRAEASQRPVAPNKALYFGVAIFFALLLGVLLSFLKHYAVARIKSKADLTEVFDAAVLARIQKLEPGITQETVVTNLYTNLALLFHKKRKATAKTVLITSMKRKEGKSFTCLNLARLFARMGKKVLIVDFNPSSSILYDALNVKNENGLSAVLQKQLSIRQAALKTSVKDLDIIPSGQLQGIYSGILFAPQTLQQIAKLKKEYDVILLDTPAINQVEDISLLMQQVDYKLILFRYKKTKIKTAKAAQQIFKGMNLPNLYAVLNDVPHKNSSLVLNPNAYVQRIWEVLVSNSSFRLG